MEAIGYINSNNGQLVTIGAGAVTQISPPFTSERVGCRGSNPTTGVLFVIVVPRGSTPPSAAQVTAGHWTYQVPAGGSWDDSGGNCDVYGYSAAGGNVWCEELI